VKIHSVRAPPRVGATAARATIAALCMPASTDSKQEISHGPGRLHHHLSCLLHAAALTRIIAPPREPARPLPGPPGKRHATEGDKFFLWGSRTRPLVLTWASMRLARIR
jgi:hypothetical protein